MGRGIDREYLDTAVSPAEDFYQFVNGGWLSTTDIPADRSSWGSFHALARNTDHQVLDLLEKELATPGAAENKAARLFETGMDTESIERSGLTPIEPILTRISQLEHYNQLPELLGDLVTTGMGILIHFSVHPDLANSHRYASYLEAASLGLPERSYYLDEDDKTISIRKHYRHYIIRLLQIGSGDTHPHPESAADRIMALEKELAIHMMSKEDRRQIDKLYNPFSAVQLSKEFSAWNWGGYFEAIGIPVPDMSIVTDPDYFRFITERIFETSVETIRDYLLMKVIHQASPYAQAELEELHFDLFSRTIDGIEQMRPRQERLVKVINQTLGEAMGQLYVTHFFPPGAKASAMEMVQDILQAFRNRITQLDWMSEATKTYALEKLAAFRVKIGYPDQWKDYTDLRITPVSSGGTYLQNLMAYSEWKWNEDKGRIGKEVDKDEWFMAPQVVNAYYNPMFNEIVFPAAILQPPFFDWQADAAVNYGGIGAVIGHEITHGFDDQGSRFDKEGNFKEWWNGEDRQRFREMTKKLVDQFDAYYPFEDLPLNGEFTLGENIADLGGLCVAYDALQIYYQRHGHPEPIDGFTSLQRFFMSWATVWRTKIRPEALRNQIKTDPHPPGMYRAVAAPSNIDHFYRAFDITPTSPWYREKQDRIKIW